jgi:hypothetical protein
MRGRPLLRRKRSSLSIFESSPSDSAPEDCLIEREQAQAQANLDAALVPLFS